MKIYPFTTLCWMNKDQNIKPNKFSQPIRKCISHSYWKQIHCLKLLFSVSTSIYLFEFNNINSRIKCEICSKLTIEAPDIILVLNCWLWIYLAHSSSVFFGWLWTWKWQMKHFIALFRIPVTFKKQPITVSSNYLFFVRNSSILDVAQGLNWNCNVIYKTSKGYQGAQHEQVSPWGSMKNSPS